MALVPEAYRNHPDLVKTYPEVRGLITLALSVDCPSMQPFSLVPACKAGFECRADLEESDPGGLRAA
eukprot:scaffold212229_cov19-Tisochrysis_lutea.AAC.1